MDELISLVEKNIRILKNSIDLNKKYFEYPFSKYTDHYYSLMLLHNKLDSWENFSKILESFKSSRCKPIEKKSLYFEKVINLEKKGMPGFITIKTQNEIIKYLKQLEWKVDELSGVWKNEKNTIVEKI
jgi:hypothetical protein